MQFLCHISENPAPIGKSIQYSDVSKPTFQFSIPFIHMIDKWIFLNEYEAVLIDANGRQLATKFDANHKIEIVNQWHHVKAKIESYNLAFVIRLDNNEVSVVQTEQLKFELKELGFISLTVRLKKEFKSMLELSFWRLVMLKVLKGYLDSRKNVGSSST